MNDSTTPLDETNFANHPFVKFWETGAETWQTIEATRKEGEQTPNAIPRTEGLPSAYVHKNKVKIRDAIA